MGRQSLDVFPYPRRPIGYHTQSHLLFRGHTGLFDLLERRAQLFLCLHLMPTQQMYEPGAIKQI